MSEVLQVVDNDEVDEATRQAAILTAAEVAAASDNHTHCLVCYSDLTTRGKTPCEHDDICGICHLRLRSLHGDKKCPICKAENERLIVDRDPTKRFSEYPMWGDEIGAEFTHRDDVGMFFETASYEQEVLPLFGYGCTVQKCEWTAEQELHNQQSSSSNNSKKHTPLRWLQDHLRTQHRLTLCTLCVDHKRDFVSQLPRWTPSQLQKHLKQGDGPTSGFDGHPLCEFCKPKRFYDLSFLHQHLHKDHYKCHVCEKAGIDNQFFKNYNSLEKHFDQRHFLCHDVQCLGARFVVFENELDLRGHELHVHGGTSTGSTKINLEFRTRRAGHDGSGMAEQNQATPSESDFNYGLDGQAFVPQALPTSGAGGNRARSNSVDVQLHPLHLQRTEELRAQAAVIREQQSVVSQAEAFPTLQSATAGSSAAPLVGWAGGGTLQGHRQKRQAGKVTTEDFPTLGPAPSAKSTAQKNALKGTLGATRRQFAAMNTSAAARSPPAAGWGGAPSAPTSAQTNNFFVPPTRPAVNRQADLAADNFPALGPSGNARPTYTAAHNLAKKVSQQPSAPSLNSAIEFPTVAAANRPQGNKPKSVRNRVMMEEKAPTQQAMSNMLQAPAAASVVSAKATVEEMKASLGPNKFKQLKRLTKDFAGNSISPEGYVDQSAALFDRGYADPDFWSFLPSLLESCPNSQTADHALQYMNSLRRQQFAENKPTATRSHGVAPAASNNNPSWGGSGPALSKVAQPPATRAAPVAARTNNYFPPPARPTIVASKKKTAWGGTGAATVVRAKAPPGSVAAAAASQGPQGGSATKFMAKQSKQVAKNSGTNNQTNNGKSNGGNKQQKKKKQKDELRVLAFGGN
jgi:hypothetical protein